MSVEPARVLLAYDGFAVLATCACRKVGVLLSAMETKTGVEFALFAPLNLSVVELEKLVRKAPIGSLLLLVAGHTSPVMQVHGLITPVPDPTKEYGLKNVMAVSVVFVGTAGLPMVIVFIPLGTVALIPARTLSRPVAETPKLTAG